MHILTLSIYKKGKNISASTFFFYNNQILNAANSEKRLECVWQEYTKD